MKAWGLTPTAWDDLPRGDQAIILAHESNEAERCPSCGHRLDSDEPFQIVKHECTGCQKLAKIADGEKKRNPGIFYALRRIIKPPDD